MASLFDQHLGGLLNPLRAASKSRTLGADVSTEADVASLVVRNMNRPVSAGTQLATTWGTPDKFLSEYRNFNNLYKMMIEEELSAKNISEVKRRILKVHQVAPSINLNILSYSNKEMLKETFRGSGLLDIEGLFSQFGVPGYIFPSENMYRLGGKMLTDKSMGAHPFLSLLDTLNFSIDPFATSLKGIDVGYSNLPSFEALESMYKQGSDLSEVMQKIRSAGKAKMMIYDVETSGLGVFSAVRNLGAISLDATLDASGKMVFGTADVVTSMHTALPEMMDINVAKRVAGRPDTKVNYAQHAFENERSSVADELFDLSTKEGRIKARDAYKDFFRKALERDYIVGHNVQFDIQKVLMSAGLIDEFADDKEAMKLMADFAQMIKDGKVINTVDLLRSSQMEQALEAAKAVGLTGVDGQRFAEELIRTTYSDKALGAMGFKSVAPASIENALLSSNLIDLIERSGADGADLISSLSSGMGTHTSETDSRITGYILRFVQSGDLRWGVPNTNPNAHRVAVNAMKSKAYTTLTKMVDTEGMGTAALKYVQSDEGIQGVKLYDEVRNETISYNKSKKQWTASRLSTDGSKIETVLGENATRNRVLAAIDASVNKRDSELVDLGISYQQQSRALSMLDNVGNVVNNISTTVGNGLDRLRTTAAGLSAANDSVLDNAFLRALGSTQEEIGFTAYLDSHNMPDSIIRGMTEYGSAIGPSQKAAYIQRLAEGGLANSMLDPSIRRMAVEVARTTSGIPYSQGMLDITGMAKKNIINRFTSDVAAGTMQQSELDEILSLSDIDFNKRYGAQISLYNSQMKNVSEAASELGVSFLRSQKAVSTITRTGGMSVTVAPTEMLKKIQVTIDDGTPYGKKVDFLSEEFLKDRRYNKFSLSIAQQKDKKFVNLILDQDVIDRTMAEELAQGYLDQIQEAIDLGDDKKLLDDGLFSSQEQINEYRTILSAQESKDNFFAELARNIEERGIGVAGIGGEAGTEEYDVASALETMIRERGEGIGNQTIAAQEGMQFELTRIDENLAEMQVRVQDEEIGIVRAADAELADYLEDTGTGGMRATVAAQRDALMERAAKDSDFAQRIIKEEATRVNKRKGFLYKLLGRSSRDADLIDAYRRLKPKIGYGALAVGALGAGYYINEKRKENDLYDETIEQQPYEKTNFVSEQNSGFTQINSPISSRRDPLATAGVVGTLDRNKIGHTQMGPNKYNHLYGR